MPLFHTPSEDGIHLVLGQRSRLHCRGQLGLDFSVHCGSDVSEFQSGRLQQCLNTVLAGLHGRLQLIWVDPQGIRRGRLDGRPIDEIGLQAEVVMAAPCVPQPRNRMAGDDVAESGEVPAANSRHRARTPNGQECHQGQDDKPPCLVIELHE